MTNEVKGDEVLYDIVIIGGGLGGLLCGYIMSIEGRKVCILEKNNQIGGSLQTFVRNRRIFDTGVHYVGGLDKDQPLYKYFKYFGLMDKLKLKRMDEDAFEKISFGDTGKTYTYGMGYDNFKKILGQQFPDYTETIDKYCKDILELCDKFPMYKTMDIAEEELPDMSILKTSAKEYFTELTDNVELQYVLAATNLLYGGEADKTPFYIHALVLNSYIESAYRFVDGGSQIARILERSIRKAGGELYKYAEVDYIHVEEEAEYARLKNGKIFRGKYFISDIHPAGLMDMVTTDKIRKAYRNRVQGLENSISVFILNVVLKPNLIKYENSNHYHFDKMNDVWDSVNYDFDVWPSSYAVFFPVHSKSPEYVDSLTIMAYMKYDDVKQWEQTFNTVAIKGERNPEYETFKENYAQKLIDKVALRMPELKGAIEEYYVATPLTYRDYIGTKDGSMYGIMKNYNDPIRTFLAPRTRVKNILITGQNLHVHGIYGVTVSAVKTCSELLGTSYLMGKIIAANDPVTPDQITEA